MLNYVLFFLFVDEFKGFCLLDACRQSDVARLKKYLSSDTANFKHPYTGDTPLHCVASSPFPKRKQVLETLIRKGANLNEKNKNMLTPLHVGCDKAHVDVMDALLRHGAAVNALDDMGQTALHRCARDDNVQGCRLLLSYNVDPAVVSMQGFTAVQVATENVLKLLQGTVLGYIGPWSK